jgi:hypothetical protein
MTRLTGRNIEAERELPYIYKHHRSIDRLIAATSCIPVCLFCFVLFCFVLFCFVLCVNVAYANAFCTGHASNNKRVLI